MLGHLNSLASPLAIKVLEPNQESEKTCTKPAKPSKQVRNPTHSSINSTFKKKKHSPYSYDIHFMTKC